MSMAAVLLGVVDAEISDNGDHLSWDVSKIGGVPVWMCGETRTPVCPVCGLASTLVVQIYCPLDGSPYHRALYLFACTNRSCWNQPKSWIVLRSQVKDEKSLEDPNSLKSTVNKPDEWGVDPDDWADEVHDGQTTSVTLDKNGTAATWCEGEDDWGSEEESFTMTNVSQDSETRQNITVSNSSQVVTPNQSLNKAFAQIDMNLNETCETPTTEDDTCISEDVLLPQDCAISSYLNVPSSDNTQESKQQNCVKAQTFFKGRYICVIEEPEDCDSERLHHEKQLLAQYIAAEGDISSDHSPKLVKGRKEKPEGGGESYEKAVARHGDKVFQKFKKRLSRYPQQILRYSYNGSPLNLTAPSKQDISPCTQCGAPRVFELQLMPGLVSFMSTTQSTDIELEFGTVMVYTCSASCWKDHKDTALTEAVLLQADPDQHLFK